MPLASHPVGDCVKVCSRILILSPFLKLFLGPNEGTCEKCIFWLSCPRFLLRSKSFLIYNSLSFLLNSSRILCMELRGQCLPRTPRKSGHILWEKWCHYLTRWKLSSGDLPQYWILAWLLQNHTQNASLKKKLRLATFSIIFSFPLLPIPVVFPYSCCMWTSFSHQEIAEDIHSNKRIDGILKLWIPH